MEKTKTYRAIRHDIIRKKQSENCDTVHHPNEKINQILKTLENKHKLKILELFAGQGNLTKIYDKFGTVFSFDKTHLKTGDSYIQFHKLIAEKQKFNVIDLDPYGFPNRFFPDIFLLMDDGYMFITMPKPFVNILNGITRTHLISYYGEHNPSLEVILEKWVLFGLCHWRKVEVLSCLDLGRLWRVALSVKKVKATEYTGVRNH